MIGTQERSRKGKEQFVKEREQMDIKVCFEDRLAE